MSHKKSDNPAYKKMNCIVCEKEFISKYRHHRNGYQKCCSFNCAQSLRSTKHGAARKHGRTIPEYHAWEAIIQRCTNENNPQYKDYGGRGITICNEWLNSFEEFFKHVGKRPDPKLTIDRVDNNKGYEPGNVEWRTRKRQSFNRRNNLNITIDGKTKCLAEWCEIYNISYQTAAGRIRRGKDPKKALTDPIR